jgi:photosynthetic reaction center cytochrome c subunit
MKTKIKIIAISTFALFALAFLAPKSEMQTKTETAGQKFKNIKVLNDMPADQMGKVMNLFSASLGVNCNFCHVGEDFAKDDKKAKEDAREMIKMTFALNKDHFDNRPEISCNTCHNGREHPMSAPNLSPKLADERPKQPEKKPTIDEILEKYETALGGKAKLAKITSRMIKANRVEPDGKTFEAEEISQKSGKLSVTTTYSSKESGNYVINEVFDGTNAWKTGNKSEIALKADEAENIKREAQLFANADLKTVYSKLEVRFFDKLDGKDVWLITATTADNKRERLYFDVVTGLLVRRISNTPTILGNFQYQVDYQDYKDFGGVKLPITMKFAVPNISWTRKILDVKNNVNIDDAKFSRK